MLHELKNQNRKSKRIGRGKTRGQRSTRGIKGQKKRAGHSIRVHFRDMLQSLPKRRGHGKNRSRGIIVGKIKQPSINLSKIDLYFKDGDRVTPGELQKRKLIRFQGGKITSCKILSKGDITKKITISDCDISKTAKEKIEKAGGKVYER